MVARKPDDGMANTHPFDVSACTYVDLRKNFSFFDNTGSTANKLQIVISEHRQMDADLQLICDFLYGIDFDKLRKIIENREMI